jgi:stage IV sporulation protein B
MYDIEISKIYDSGSDGGKNMLIVITDQRLLDATGGIVQGMSGSPILQNGKLIGGDLDAIVAGFEERARRLFE